jgi:hypothetical protein
MTALSRFGATTWTFAILIALPALMISTPEGATAKKRGTVHIRGTAYAFFDIDDRVPAAIVRVAEYPDISDPVAADGSYDIEVPDDATITPYIEAPEGYEDLYLQTFHTSGSDLEHVNFQIVPTGIYTFLASTLGVPLDENDKIEQCAIVSTFSIHEARDATTFDPGFKDVYPHGLPGSKARLTPVVGNSRGPIYFNEIVFPDLAQPSSSVDGGVLWVDVPPGYYWLEATHPTERLAPFLAHCENGRLVNANPPWGFYELEDGEEPDPASLAVDLKDADKAAKDQEKIGKKLSKGKRPKVSLFE